MESQHSLYAWIKSDQPEPVRIAAQDQQATIKQLQSELKRITEERDILKKAAARLTGGCNTCVKFIGRRAKVQGFPWALIEL